MPNQHARIQPTDGSEESLKQFIRAARDQIASGGSEEGQNGHDEESLVNAIADEILSGMRDSIRKADGRKKPTRKCTAQPRSVKELTDLAISGDVNLDVFIDTLDSWTQEYVKRLVEWYRATMGAYELHGKENSRGSRALIEKIEKSLLELRPHEFGIVTEIPLWIERLREMKQSQQLDEAILAAFCLGHLLTMSAHFDALRSVQNYRATLDRLKDGWASQFGDTEKKRRVAIDEFDRLMRDDPGLKKTVAQKRAGEKAGVSGRQVRTYLKERGNL